MSQKNDIEWTDATWNPVSGCSKVSPGCAHCYAERLSLRFGHSVSAVDQRSIERLQRMKDYLFSNPEWTHADQHIAAAWHRLRTGAGTARDQHLLRHETAEMWYRTHVLDAHGPAHAAANRWWNRQALVEQWQ